MKVLILIALSLVSAAGGYLAGGFVIGRATGGGEGNEGSSWVIDRIDLAQMQQSFGAELAGVFREQDKGRQRLMLDGVIEKLSEAEMESAMMATLAQKGEDRSMVATTLLKRWFQLNPKVAVSHARTLSPDVLNKSLWSKLLVQWTEDDPAAAQAWAMAQPVGRRQREAVITVAETLVTRDPAGAIRLLQPLNLLGEQTQVFEKLMGQWGVKDFDAAYAQALQTKNVDARRAMFRGLLACQSHKPPEEVLKWAQLLPDYVARNEAMKELLDKWSERDPVKSLEYAVDLNPGEFRTEILRDGVRKLASNDLHQAVHFFERLTNAIDRLGALESLIFEWYYKDPEASIQFAKSLPDEKERIYALERNVACRASNDPNDAIPLLELLPSGRGRDRLAGEIASDMSKKNIEKGAQFALENVAFREKGVSFIYHPLHDILSDWMEKDEQAALLWAGNIQNKEIRKKILGSVLTRLPDPGFKNALRIAAGLDAEIRDYVLCDIAPQLALRGDVETAKAMISKIPSGPDRNKAAVIIADSMAYVDVSGAAVWLSQSSGLPDQEVITRYSYSPDIGARAGLELVTKIQNPKLRLQVIEDMVETWMESSEVEVTQWVQNSKFLDEGTKQRLLQK